MRSAIHISLHSKEQEAMAKYDPLNKFLSNLVDDECDLTHDV